MGTFLTTSKMDPALAARVLASVRGKSRGGRSVLRFGLVLLVVVGGVSFFRARQRDRAELAEARASLLVAARGRQLGERERKIVDRVEAAAIAWSRVDEEILGVRGALFEEILKRPAIWLRGPIGQMPSPRRIAEASAKDALLLCLLDPPRARTEKDLYEQARIAYGPEIESHTSNVRRLFEAMVGLPFLGPDFVKRIENAADANELSVMKHDLDRAPIDRAMAASKSEILIVAADEPGDGVVELDGERPHHVRVGIVDLASGAILLKVRKKVDPTWISAGKRASYAAGIDGCTLAWDVRQALK